MKTSIDNNTLQNTLNVDDYAMHLIDERLAYLRTNRIVCPKCTSRNTRVRSVKFMPEWICDNCNNKFYYEPVVVSK